MISGMSGRKDSRHIICRRAYAKTGSGATSEGSTNGVMRSCIIAVQVHLSDA